MAGMATTWQLTFDCADPDRLARFWAFALDYAVEPPPSGFDTWRAYWRSVGVPDEELDDGADSVVDPAGAGPRIWFQRVPEAKAGKNRVHLDIRRSGGRGVPLEVRRERVAAAVQRLVEAGATRVRVLSEPGIDHYAVTMRDPEGNEFCVN
jgi:hypothetical protein